MTEHNLNQRKLEPCCEMKSIEKVNESADVQTKRYGQNLRSLTWANQPGNWLTVFALESSSFAPKVRMCFGEDFVFLQTSAEKL